MGRSRALAVVATTVVLAGGGWFVARERPRPTPHAVAPSLTTTEIRRGDLSDDRLRQGTLGFGPARTLKGSGEGVLTRLPAAGTTFTRGTRLYRVNDQPVVVFFGGTPLFRSLGTTGLTGADVLELRRNLAALGYRSAARRPEVMDESLLSALRRWQRDLGVTSPGTLRPGQVVVVDGPSRVESVVAQPGDPAAGPVLSITATAKVVSVPVETADAGSARAGTSVAVELPDGRSVPGRVTAVTRTAAPGDGDAPKVTVTVEPRDPKTVATFDAAPVQVRFTTVARRDVLIVPVGALVALREGGYALQRPDGVLIPVTVGVIARGMAEVSGSAITEGAKVVTTP